MKKTLTLLLIFAGFCLSAQDHPAITSWLQNNTMTGSFYMQGNGTAIDNNLLVNCQLVEYSDDFVYVHSNGIPSYPTGPFLDGNPSQASSQSGIWKIPLEPTENTGAKDNTTGGNIGIFINGVALFDYRDGVAWNPNTNAPCGGPGNPPCPGGMMSMQDWNRDAIPAEREGFDCAKGHPAMGNYHHHQNPTAFKLDKEVVSDICNIYDAEGLYLIDETTHSPLIGYAYDGFPIYGAYAFANVDGTGGITRMKSGYSLRNITTRTTHADGSSVSNGPDVGGDYFLGYFREDYEFTAQDEDDVLDEHNGRFCVTPKYPMGTYAYFATVDENWNSTYPYAVGPTFYGHRENRKVNNVNEATTIYVASAIVDNDMDGFDSEEDCDDNNAAINPDAIEIPNNDIDEDCDGIALMIDQDMDGFNSDEDCDDNNPNVNPGQAEIPNNNIDEDCDGNALVIDEDMDGFNSDEDCDDNNPNVNPGQAEIPNNDVDEDCDDIALVIDEDMDGFNSDEDCNDQDASINPGADEIPGNGIDEDCNGFDDIVDEDMDGFDSDEDCDDNDAGINPDAEEIPNNDIDENCDGIVLIIDEDMDGFNSSEDCNDADASINPGAEEVPNNDIDEDCDGTALVIDEDMDGFNSSEDCNDADGSINPGAEEIPNNDIDEDCDGIALVIDNDIDGFNSDEDCDDDNADINPGADEIPNNGIDEDCDGVDLITGLEEIEKQEYSMYPNPAFERISFQAVGLTRNNIEFTLMDELGRSLKSVVLKQGSTIANMDVRTIYNGTYLVRIKDGNKVSYQKLIIAK